MKCRLPCLLLMVFWGVGCVLQNGATLSTEPDAIGGADGSEPYTAPNSGEPAFNSGLWFRTGGPPGGLGYDIRMRPDNPDIMYVTDDGAGAFMSTNGGELWTPITDGVAARFGRSGDSIPVFCLTIDPNNYDRLWLGTSAHSGVFRSDDQGQTWEMMNNGIDEGLSVRGFTVEPGNSNVVYVSGEVPSHIWAGESTLGAGGMDLVMGFVYKTEDGGENWRLLWNGENLARHVLVDPDNTERIFVGTGIFDRNAFNSDGSTGDPGGVGILRSHDGGESWEILNEDNGFDPVDLYFGSLSMHPENPDIILAGAGQDPFGLVLNEPIGGVYLTEDGGDTWTENLDLGNVGAVEFCPGDPNVAYAASINGFHRSSDGGQSWEERVGHLWGADDFASGFPIDLECDPRDANRAFVNSYVGGNLLTEDGGATWRDASEGYTGAKIASLVISSTDPRRVWATDRIGAFTTSDGGRSWVGLNHGPARPLEGMGISIDPTDENHLILCQIDSGPIPLESHDGGQSWEQMPTGLEFENAHFAQVVFSANDSQTLIGVVATSEGCWRGLDAADCSADGGYGLVISHDAGANWDHSGLDEGDVVSLAFAGDENGSIYASVYAEGIFRSDDNGDSWDFVANPAEMLASNSLPDATGPGSWAILAVDPNNSQRIYAGLSAAAVAISEDGGLTWNISSGGMPSETTIVDFAIDQSNEGVVYAASSETGVYVSTDYGHRWTALSDGLTRRQATRLALSTDGSILYVGTQGGGVFRMGAID